MIQTDQLKTIIDELNVDRRSTFAEFIDKLFHGKFIEIYLGDSYEEISTEQISNTHPAIICGRVEGAYREVLVINSAYVEKLTKKTSTLKLGNLMFINERSIRVLSEVDGVGKLDKMLLRSEDALNIIRNLNK